MKDAYAILGAGLSGRAAAALAETLGHGCVCFDQAGGGDRSEFDAAIARQFKAIIVSPGFARAHPWREAARLSGRPIHSELAFAGQHWRGPIYGITGTNGKTSLTQLLAEAYDAAGYDGVAAGNIGRPFAACAASDLNRAETAAFLEISSFQAELSPALRLDALLWTNLAEDHLDRYADMADYCAAKARLFDSLAAGAPCFLGASVKPWLPADRAPPPGCRWMAPPGRAPQGLRADSIFARPPQSENYALAAAFWSELGLPMAALEGAAADFRPPPHRCAPVATVAGVSFWNDSKATNFHAALAAVEGLPRPLVWLGGGQSKGGDLAAFARALAPRIDEAVVYGEVAAPLAAALRSAGCAVRLRPAFAAAVTAAAAAGAAKAQAHGSAAVCLSPGFASFDQFTSYAERGKTFIGMVLDLKEESAVD
jgi:UDP-N-acetylmuramoylalanine--D-glutamate ligase